MKVDAVSQVDLQQFRAMSQAAARGLLRIDHLDEYVPALHALNDLMVRRGADDPEVVNLGRYLRRRVGELAPEGTAVIVPGWVPGAEWGGQEARLIEIDGMEPHEWLKAELCTLLADLEENR